MTEAVSTPPLVLRPDQAVILNHPAQVKIVSAARRWGKNILGIAYAKQELSQGRQVVWVEPDYKRLKPTIMAWEAMTAYWEPHPQMSAVIQFVTYDQRPVDPGAMASISWVGNEAQSFPANTLETWLAPVSEVGGRVLLLGTPPAPVPEGSTDDNWFVQLCREFSYALGPWRVFRRSIFDNPGVLEKHRSDSLLLRLPERVFRTQWLGDYEGVDRKTWESL